MGQFYRKMVAEAADFRRVSASFCTDFLEGLILAPPTSPAPASHGVSIAGGATSWRSASTASPPSFQGHELATFAVVTSPAEHGVHRIMGELWGCTDACVRACVKDSQGSSFWTPPDPETLWCLQCLWEQTEPAGAAAVAPVQVNEPQSCSCCRKGANQLWRSPTPPSVICAFPFWACERRLSSGGSQQSKRFAHFSWHRQPVFSCFTNISHWKCSWTDIFWLNVNSCQRTG